MENIRRENRIHLEALSEISEAITSETYLDDILRIIAVVTAKVMGSNICLDSQDRGT